MDISRVNRKFVVEVFELACGNEVVNNAIEAIRAVAELHKVLSAEDYVKRCNFNFHKILF